MSAECNALAGAASDGSVVGSHAVTYRLSGRPMRTTTCRFRCVGQCLSRMRRKVQVRFLGEGAAATPLPYPTRRRMHVRGKHLAIDVREGLTVVTARDGLFDALLETDEPAPLAAEVVAEFRSAVAGAGAVVVDLRWAGEVNK